MLASTGLTFREESRAERVLLLHCTCGVEFAGSLPEPTESGPAQVWCPCCHRLVRFSTDGMPSSF